jgi:hypothetical protein
LYFFNIRFLSFPPLPLLFLSPFFAFSFLSVRIYTRNFLPPHTNVLPNIQELFSNSVTHPVTKTKSPSPLHKTHKPATYITAYSTWPPSPNLIAPPTANGEVSAHGGEVKQALELSYPEVEDLDLHDVLDTLCQIALDELGEAEQAQHNSYPSVTHLQFLVRIRRPTLVQVAKAEKIDNLLDNLYKDGTDNNAELPQVQKKFNEA